MASTTLAQAATVIAASDTTIGTIAAGTDTIYIDGTDADFQTSDGVIWDGTTTAVPSDFNNNLVNSGPNEDGQSLSSYFFSNWALQIIDVPVVTRDGVDYFGLVMDAQETNQSGYRLLSTQMTINIHPDSSYNNPTEVWSSSYAVQINGNLPASEGGGAQNLTSKGLGQGADLLVLVPVSYFYSFSTDAYFEWVVTQEDSDNGDDEWALAPGTTFYLPGITLSAESETQEAVPEPSSLSLLGAAALLSLMRRRRR